jgi:predicted DNA-binding mobile mystery protein A
MNKNTKKLISLRQLETQLSRHPTIANLERPSAGWLRAIRQALGLSLKVVATRLGQTPPAAKQAEDFEVAGTITLRRLEAAAAAMGCRLVYAIVPLRGSLTDLAHFDDNEALKSVQRTMALEGQAIENPTGLT